MDNLPATPLEANERWRDLPVILGKVAIETCLLAIIWVAANQLGAWGWSLGGLAFALTGWTVISTLAAVWRRVAPALLLELAGGLLLAVGGQWGWTPSSAGWGEMAYGFCLSAVILTGWRSWRRRVVRELGDEAKAEPLRVLLVTVASMGVLLPMFTDRLLGGTDARWYAYMLHDFIEQWRMQGPPVFLGQGEFAWNGAVHPFRSAPVFMHVAGLWDWLTLQSLPAVALQHLAAISAATAGGWGLYAAGVKLAPRHRWGVAVIAAVYAMNPAALMALYVADAYMTYMACAAFVWVFYGNMRVLLEGRGWLGLSAGLSLAWMSHPPTAMQVTLISASLQLGGLALGNCRWVDWRNVSWAGLWFVVLSGYYFVGMSELPRAPVSDQGAGLFQVLLLLGGWFAITRIIWVAQSWKWAWVLVPVVPGLWWLSPLWLAWLGLGMAMVGLIRRMLRRWELSGHAALVMAVVILISAWAGDWLLREGYIGTGGYPRVTQGWSSILKADFFKPLTDSVLSTGDVQPGWALWMAGLLGVVAACRRGAVAEQLLCGALLLLLPILLHWPGAGSFIVEHMPHSLVTMSGLTMELRMMPICSVMLAFAGLMWLRAIPQELARGKRWWLGAGLLLALGWSSWQARHFLWRGRQITAVREVQVRDWRSENALLDHFAYDLLPIPGYYSHGKMDPRLEVRLLDDRGNLIYGPTHMAAAMEAAGSEILRLNTQLLPGHAPGQSDWLQLEPRLVMAAGAHQLLRFEFDQERKYAGYLIMQSEYGYREYLLPEFGRRRAFGAGPESSRLMSLWNSGSTPENYQLQFLLRPGHDLSAGMGFATVTVSSYRPELAGIRLESLNPWRVSTDLPWSGQLETPRVFLPGYEVWVDGRRLGADRISASPDRLLQIAMPPGRHTVEVRYVGTVKLRLAGVISLLAWGLLLAGWISDQNTWLGRRVRAL